ncbi:MAG TPA: phenylalanine--tRNA ligase subunit beta [Candidatus Pacearchaeota archaeon]|nr:phenylalanine--tRNA ligase subunit beta [Candidatus Pacearchaeota archaeon]
MIFSYNWLQSFFKEKLPRPEKLAELLTMHSFEVEEVKKIQNSKFQIPKSKAAKDYLLDIDVLPNRGCDCLSHLGIAREIAALLKKSKIQNPKSKPKEDKNLKTKDFIKVKVEDKNACKRYTARFMAGVNISVSPQWMQNRLRACGLQSINNVVDALNYVMLEMGQPLHAFDYDKISNNPPIKSNGARILENSSKKNIIIRFAAKGEKIVTLDKKNYQLDEDILIIADEKQPLALAGIKGGKVPEIDKNTKNLVIESANFDQRVIRYASKKLNLRTDASTRFEQKIDPNLTEEAINRAVFLIQQLSKGKVAEGMIDIYPKKEFPKKIKLDLDYVESLLGIKISQKEIIKILKSLGLKIVNCKLRTLNVVVPTLRTDISIPEDLVEEIGRVYGYEKIQPQSPILPLKVSGKNRDLLWERKIKEMLKGLGLNEVYLYSFISERDAELFSIRKNSPLPLIEIKNPTSSNTKYLRPSLLSNLLKTIERNQAFLKKEIRIFEIGKTYHWNVESGKLKAEKQPSTSDSLHSNIVEKKMLAGVITGNNKFFELKGILEGIFEGLGMVDVFFDEFRATPEETPQIFWQAGESAEIKIGDIEIGFLGKIRPEILNFYNINKTPIPSQNDEAVEVFAFEIDFKKLLNLVEEEHEYKMPSPYPESIKDIAVLVPSQTLAGEVIQTIHQIDEENLIRDVEIFDIFEGPPLPKGKKNLAFHIVFQANDRTLSSKEIDAILNKIIDGLEENEEWKVRR